MRRCCAPDQRAMSILRSVVAGDLGLALRQVVRVLRPHPVPDTHDVSPRHRPRPGHQLGLVSALRQVRLQFGLRLLNLLAQMLQPPARLGQPGELGLGIGPGRQLRILLFIRKRFPPGALHSHSLLHQEMPLLRFLLSHG